MPATTLRRLWAMLAHLQGQVVDKSALARNLEIAQPTVGRCMDLLTDLLLVRQLPPWSGNIGKRLVRRPRYYIRDSGLVHALLGIRTMNDLLAHPVVGKSWEGFVVENLLAAAPDRALPFFFETSAQAEIDLLFEIGVDRRIAVEIKRTLSPALSRGFHSACEALGVTEKYVVYPGKLIIPRKESVTVPPQEMMEVLREL